MTRDEVLELIREVLYRLDNPQLDAADIDQAIAELKTCQHDWVDATNKYVQNTYMCLKCGELRAKSEHDAELKTNEKPKE